MTRHEAIGSREPPGGLGSIAGRAGPTAIISAAVIVGGILVAGFGGAEEERCAEAGYGELRCGRLHIEVFRAPTVRGYGYTISTDEGVLIHQPHVPAVPGKAGFASAADARRVAELVVRRMKLGVFPPSVTLEDLDTVGIRDPRIWRDETRRR